ncbi:HU family DNA-binding protein [Marinobacterium litorale]|uniref:HU family DNA-binding protein n=1 Tax=Marinobacterium litorale TaxID=404770 RepID=UPI0004097E2F|nr:HU family DNA-binding protein [Marinobacterium litorale]
MTTKSANQLAPAVAFQARLTQLQAEQAIQAIGNAVLKEIKQGHAVEFENFGLFDLGTRPSDGTPALRFRQHRTVREALSK